MFLPRWHNCDRILPVEYLKGWLREMIMMTRRCHFLNKSAKALDTRKEQFAKLKIRRAAWSCFPVALVGFTLLAAGCGSTGPLPLQTLDGHKPLIIAHRGASGYLPEHTLEAYQLAITQGADVIEPDLISTKDGVLIARHDPNLATSTDVASRPGFASRKRVDWSVDGEKQTGWFAHDFTLAEIRTLGAVITDPERPRQNDGTFKIATLQEIIDLAKTQSAKRGRTVMLYPETKNPSYHRDLGLPLEDRLIAALNAAGWNSRAAPVFVQSFEPDSLKEMRGKGLKTRMVQLIDGDDIDLKTGKITYAIPFDRPYDWFKSGDARLFADMVTPAGLDEIRTYADGIGVWKPYIVPVKGQLNTAGQLVDVNGDGTVDLRDATTQPPTTLVAEAHKRGLFVHVFTFRDEERRLACTYQGDPQSEYLQFFRLGVDGVFSEFPDTAVMARAAYLCERGH
jgi:glycerophosphoryl diester phosphodiesterase